MVGGVQGGVGQVGKCLYCVGSVGRKGWRGSMLGDNTSYQQILPLLTASSCFVEDLKHYLQP